MEKLKTREFRLKDIVWAKAKGDPWWPGIIKKISFYNIQKNNHIIREKIYSIDFIGEKSHVKLSKENIELFIENYKKHLSAKQPSLIRSIKLAKKMCDKNSAKKIINLNEKKNNENIYDINEQKIKDKEIFKTNKKNEKNKKDLCQNAGDSEYNYDSDDEMSSEDYKKNKETKSKKIQKDKNNEKKDNNIKINININLTNNNNTFNIFDLQNIGKMAHNIDINEKNEKNYLNKKNEEKKDIKKEGNSPSLIMPKLINLDINNNFNKQNNKEDNRDNNKNDKEKVISKNKEIGELAKRLINYQINLDNSINHQIIINELEILDNIINNNLSKEENFQNIDIMDQDLLSVLLAFKFHKNKEINQKAINILNILTEYIIKDIFIFNEIEKNNLKAGKNNRDNNTNLKIIDNEYNFGLELCKLINQNKSNINLLNKKVKYIKQSNNNDSSSDSDLSDDNYQINEELYNIICNLKTEKTINEFNIISEDFYKYIYNKNNNGLDLRNSLKRKKICIKLFNLIRKIHPKKNVDLIKKLIIYYEYKIRSQDSTLGKKYYKIINNLFNKIKTLL